MPRLPDLPRSPGLLLTIFLSLGTAIMAGWLLSVGKTVILPVLSAVISVYVLTNAARSLKTFPGLRMFPNWVLHLAVLVAFIVVLTVLGTVVVHTMEDLAGSASIYQKNLETLISRGAALAGAGSDPTWDDIRRATIGQIDLASWLRGWFGVVSGFSATLFLVVVYAGFLMVQQARFPAKVAAAFPDPGDADRVLRIGGEINRKIADYLSVKTTMNVVLAVLSYAVLKLLGVDFALFWALVIGLLNYIPYIGSFAGVAFPVLLSMAQYAEIGRTVALMLLLTGMQVFVGSVLEPRWLGRQLNLSPVAILLALSLWSSIWGVAGAILAVPLTSVLVIVFAQFRGTRPIAVLISDIETDVPQHHAPHRAGTGS